MNLNQLNAELESLIAQQQFDAAETLLRQYSEVTPPDERSAPFSAPVRLKANVEAEATEAAIALPIVNALSRKIRNARYRHRVGNGYKGIRVVEEGDSWHQYPVLLDDIIDVVSDDYAVYSLAAAGDTIDAMAVAAEYVDAIEAEKPQAFLISAGGNDLLGEGRLSTILKTFTPGAEPNSLINGAAFKTSLDKVIARYRDIVRRALQKKPDLKIFFHGYDYPHPVAGGRWLGAPLADKGIPLDVGREVLKVIVDRFNEALGAIAAEHPQNVRHIDLRNRVDKGATSWTDELHPKNPGFQRAAEPIGAALSALGAPELAAVNAVATPLPQPEAVAVTARDRIAYRMRPLADRARADNRRARYRLMMKAPEIVQAQRDVDTLLSKIDEPDTLDRIQAREEYSFFASRKFLEQIIDDNNMDEYFVLPRGTLAGKAVARLFVRSPGAGGSYGTGFLVAPGLLLTNNHVIPDAGQALNTIASFDYELDVKGDLRPARNFRVTGDVFLTSEALDYTLVSVQPTSSEGDSLADYGWIPLLPRSGKALKKEYVNIIQHPGGDLKKVALRENMVIGVEDAFLYYVTDTLPGSSGSPVFNEEWQAAALHHMAVPDKDNPGQFTANRGVRISVIIEDIVRRRDSGDRNAIEVDRRLQEGRVGSNGGSFGEATPPNVEAAPVSGAGLLESAAAWTAEQARGVMSDEAYTMIVDFETGGRSYYDNVIRQKPIWPGGASGVTIGFGYDLGYVGLAEFRRDWGSHLGQSVMARFESAIGKTGTSARNMIAGLSDIRVPWEKALPVFDARTLTKFVGITYSALPRASLDMLHPHCVGVLVSLVFNRGASFRRDGDRYREMRNILKWMDRQEFAKIPAELRSMKRIWEGQGLDGLLRRREAEAALFEDGLAAGHGHETFNSPVEVDVTSGADEDAFAEGIDRAGDRADPPQAHFETAVHLDVDSAKWPTNPANAPDTWHLPIDHADSEFDLTADLVRGLIKVGQYAPVTSTNSKLVLALRGCQFVTGGMSVEDATSVRLRPVLPDHENFRCLIGVLDMATNRLSLYRGSTVPRRTGMLRYYNKVNFGAGGRDCNMLPTGCYEFCVGTHGGTAGPVSFVLRLGNGPTPADAGRATVLRTPNDLTYGTKDTWDDTRPADNIHPAFLSTSFSSLGCLTVHGNQTPGGSHATGSGEWRMFRKKVGFDGMNNGKRFDGLIVTGHEAAAVAASIAAGGDLSTLTCLRHGSKGDRVKALQSQLGLNPDGDFGANTRKVLAAKQFDKLDFATGSWTPAMATLLAMNF